MKDSLLNFPNKQNYQDNTTDDGPLTTEQILLGQVRGLLILAYGHNAQGNTRLYAHYLNRTKEILNAIQKCREQYEQAVA